jgi:hypothetical protein
MWRRTYERLREKAFESRYSLMKPLNPGHLVAGADRQPETKEDTLAMTQTKPTLSAETGGTEITRFNALRHGMLSRYTVLPWEDADEYRALVAALVAEHAPQGPTEEHLVEELAGILWRKRRLRLAEAAAHRRGLDGTLGSYRETVKVALVHLDDAGQSERVVPVTRREPAAEDGLPQRWLVRRLAMDTRRREDRMDQLTRRGRPAASRLSRAYCGRRVARR